jgi:hypothetical protein
MFAPGNTEAAVDRRRSPWFFCFLGRIGVLEEHSEFRRAVTAEETQTRTPASATDAGVRFY